MATQLEQFRQQVYESVSGRPDAFMDVLDALSGNTTARSVVELSLSPLFRYEYSSLYDAVDTFFQASSPQTAAEERRIHQQKMMRLIAPYLPTPQKRKFWLLG